MVSNPNVPWYDNVVVAHSYDAYYWCVGHSTPNDPDPDTTYEKHYGPLEKRIAKVLANHRVPKEAVEFFDDWCANLTRHVYVERRYVTPRIATDLFALLRRKYADWRIELILIGSMKKHDEVGQLMIRRDWALCFRVGRQLMREVKEMHK
jgi:hypothetical protein